VGLCLCCFYLAAYAAGNNTPFKSRAERGVYDVVWDVPSGSHEETLPLGNGDMAANVWVDQVCPASMCVGVYVCVCACVCACVRVSVRVSVCLSVCLSVRLSVCLSICLSVCPSTCLSTCLSVSVYLCLCVYKTRKYTNIHIYLSVNSPDGIRRQQVV